MAKSVIVMPPIIMCTEEKKWRHLDDRNEDGNQNEISMAIIHQDLNIIDSLEDSVFLESVDILNTLPAPELDDLQDEFFPPTSEPVSDAHRTAATVSDVHMSVAAVSDLHVFQAPVSDLHVFSIAPIG